MEEKKVLELDTGFSFRDWKIRSEKGDLCGILGCFDKPAVICHHCNNHYCEEHKWVRDTPAHWN